MYPLATPCAGPLELAAHSQLNSGRRPGPCAGRICRALHVVQPLGSPGGRCLLCLSLVTHDPSAAYTAAAASDRVAPHSSAPRLVTASVAAEAAWYAVVARASDASSSARNAV